MVIRINTNETTILCKSFTKICNEKQEINFTNENAVHIMHKYLSFTSKQKETGLSIIFLRKLSSIATPISLLQYMHIPFVFIDVFSKINYPCIKHEKDE